MVANKRILIFSTAYLPWVGGAEIAVKEITDRLARRGYEFEMITINLTGRESRDEVVGAVRVHRLGGRGYFYKILYPFAALYLARRLHTKKSFTATWSIMASFSGFAAIFFKMLYPQVPYFLSLQEGDPLERPKHRAMIVWPLFTQIFRQAHRIQAISSYLRHFAHDMGARAPIEIIPNGVDVKKFGATIAHIEQQKILQQLPHVTVRLITVSRLVEKNGTEDILRALAILPEHVGLYILGTGVLEKKLREQTVALGLSTRVFFAGQVPHGELPVWLSASDIFIRPSRSEGMGNVFIEAMAAGVPIVGTPVGGIPDFLHDGETGVFCQPHNPHSIATAVQKIMHDATLQATLIANGKKLVVAYDWDLLAERMDTTFFC